jgi:hypothetical protein
MTNPHHTVDLGRSGERNGLRSFKRDLLEEGDTFARFGNDFDVTEIGSEFDDDAITDVSLLHVILGDPRRGPHVHRQPSRSILSFALLAAIVCQCMLLGASTPPQASGLMWSMTYPGRPFGNPVCRANACRAAALR